LVKNFILDKSLTNQVIFQGLLFGLVFQAYFQALAFGLRLAKSYMPSFLIRQAFR
jgi:hypothetical protein